MVERKPNPGPPAPWRERCWNATTLVWFAVTSAAKDLCGPRTVAAIAGGLLVAIIVCGAVMHRKER